MADDVSLRGINFKIVGKADEAAASIENLTKKLIQLSGALSVAANMGDFTRKIGSISKAAEKSETSFTNIGKSASTATSAFSGVAESAQTATTSVSSVADAAVSASTNINNVASSAKAASANTEGLAEKEKEAGKATKSMTVSFPKMSSVMKEAGEKASALGRALKTYFGKSILLKPLRDATEGAKSFAKGIGGIGRAFKRVLFYRSVRTLIREIGDAFKVGVNNLYQWSKALGGEFAAKMDMMSTSLQYFKNSLGAMVAPLINKLAPVFDYLIDKVVVLLNLINQLFARLTGASYWTRAVKKAKEYGDAIGGAGAAAKEALRYLAPFDELNVLPSNSAGGGGSGGGGNEYGGMFEEMVEFDERIRDFADRLRAAINAGNWQGVGVLLGTKVNEIVDRIDWAGIGGKVGTWINALFTTQYWTLKSINFQNIGKSIAKFLNEAISKVDFSTVGATITLKFTAILDAIGGFFEELDTFSVGTAIHDFFTGMFDEWTAWINSKDWITIGETLFQKVKALFSGMDVMDIAASFFRMLGAAFEAAVSMLSSFDWAALWDQIKGFISEYWEVGAVVLAINIVPKIGDILGTITKAMLLKAIFGGGGAAGAAAKAISLTPALGIALEIPLAIGLVTTFTSTLNSEGYKEHEFGRAPFLSNYDLIDLFTNPTGWAEAKISIVDEAIGKLATRLSSFSLDIPTDRSGDVDWDPVVGYSAEDDSWLKGTLDDILEANETVADTVDGGDEQTGIRLGHYGGGGVWNMQKFQMDQIPRIPVIAEMTSADDQINPSEKLSTDWKARFDRLGKNFKDPEKVSTDWKARFDRLGKNFKDPEKVSTDWKARFDRVGKNFRENDKLSTGWKARFNYIGKSFNESDKLSTGWKARFNYQEDNITDRTITGMGAVIAAVSNGMTIEWQGTTAHANGWLKDVGAIISSVYSSATHHINVVADVVGVNWGNYNEKTHSAPPQSHMSNGIHVSGSSMPVTATDSSGNEEALYRAMVRALNEVGINVDVDIDGEPIYTTVVRRNTANTRRTGVNALA